MNNKCTEIMFLVKKGQTVGVSCTATKEIQLECHAFG